jgi:ABC-type transport system involved in multi-copper enzyme maturation permease subunit
VIRLFGVEARRVAARRLVWAFLVLAVVGIAVASTIVFFRHHRLDPQHRAAALQQAEEHRARDVDACANGEFGIPEGDLPPGVSLREFCDQKAVPPAQYFLQDPRYHYVQTRDAVMGTNILFILLLGLIGASMIGAEWHAGTVTTLLTWEPRRIRVLVAKTVAVALFAFLASVALQALLALALLPSGEFRGTMAGADSAWLRDTTGIVLRGGVLAALAAVGGLAVASIARNTAFAIGVAFAWLAVIEPIVRGLRPKWEPWLLSSNAARFLAGPVENVPLPTRSTLVAGLVVALYAGALLVAAIGAFRVRDVT